jgi:hypothetical protein
MMQRIANGYEPAAGTKSRTVISGGTINPRGKPPSTPMPRGHDHGGQRGSALASPVTKIAVANLAVGKGLAPLQDRD